LWYQANPLIDFIVKFSRNDTCNTNNKIAQNKRQESERIRQNNTIEDNKFIDGQPYDKLQSAAGAGTIKVKVKIKKVAFEDGTVVNF